MRKAAIYRSLNRANLQQSCRGWRAGAGSNRGEPITKRHPWRKVTLLEKRSSLLLAGIIPDTIKAPGVTGRVPDGMANVAVAEIILDKSRIDAHIGQRKAAGVA